MSTTIDERVVEMRFDNKQFEAGASETMSTLQKLKKSLDFSNIGKSFENINKASDKVDLGGLDRAISGIHNKFSALEVMAITTLGNITNSIVNSAKRWASAFTIEPIKTGFQEYETQINAVQTILANTQKEGTKIKDVNAALDELNAYADKTIYNFTEMTRNIGTFTAAGVDLKTSVNAIQGIANLAAVSGSNSQQASTAMYQLSQALATGTVKLMDWNSVVNAGMGGQLFQDALKETSRLLGTGADAAIETAGSFRESLKEGWLTSEVLTETLKKFTTSGAAEYISKYTGLSKDAIETELELAKSTYGEADAIDKAAEALAKKSGKNKDEIAATLKFAQTAEDAATKVKTFTQLIDTLKEAVQSGWSQSFRIIVGDFEEAKKLFTEISDSFGAVISASADARNALLSEVFDKRDGRELLIDSLRNGLKGLLSVIKPVREAFREVFPPATADQVHGMLKSFHEFTKTLTLSEKNSKNLKKAFKGLFDIAKLLRDGFISLIKIIIPIEKPIDSIGDGVLSLAGYIGSLLSKFSKWVRSSESLSKAFNGLRKGSSALMGGLSKLIKMGVTFVEKLSKMEGVAKFIDAVNSAFERLYKKADPYINDFISDSEKLFGSLFDFKDVNIDDSLKAISDSFSGLALEINRFTFKPAENAFNTLRLKVKELSDTLTSNDGLSTFVTNFKKYGEELKDAFTLDNLLNRLERVMDVFGKFFNWIKTTLGPAFADFNIGTAAAGAGGLGLVYAIIKMSKAFEGIAGTLKSIPDLLGGVSDTLVAYQKDLKASALIKTAGAIAILAGALVLLSFADTDRLMSAAVALSLVAGVLMFGLTKLLGALNKGKEVNNALTIFSKGFRSAARNFGRSLVINAIGKAVKSFAESIAIIAASMIALGLMYKNDSDSLLAGVELVKIIGIAFVAIAGVLALLSAVPNVKGIAAIGSSILMMSLSLGLVVSAIVNLMKMELPTDYDKKLKILGGIVGGLAGLAVLLGLTAKIAGGNQLPKMASTIKSLAILLIATVLSLKILFDMELPSDYDKKLGILGGIFTAFGALILVMGVAAKIAGGNSFKAGGTIIAMAGFLAVVVGSLFVLTLIPGDKMLKGAIALGGVLVALGAALYGAGKITDKGVNKTVIAMAATVGVIVASLAILSMIPWEKLLVSVTSLGVVLLTLAANFAALSKVNSKKAFPALLGMIAATLAISYSLYALSEQPWQNMLVAAAAMSATLLAFSTAFQTVLSKTWSKNNPAKIGTFLALTLAVIPIGVALGVLANQPWQGMLSAGAAMSATLLAFSACFAIISKIKVDLVAIGAVVAGSASLLLVAAGISMLAKYTGQELLNACLALSAMLVVMVGVMAACAALSAVIGPAMVGVLGLGAVVAELALVLAAIGGLAQIPGLKWLIEEGGTLLQGIGTAIGQFIGGIVGGVMTGISSQLPQIGSDLSEFMVNLTPFIMGAKMIDAQSLACVGLLAGIIVALTAAEIINGITSLVGLSLVDMATELSNFMIALLPFIINSKMLTPESMQACLYLSEMIIALTAAEILSGIGKILGLGGSLSDFGKELSVFGPYIKQFAEDVKDVKPEAVQGAAAAAEIMANVAKKLPASDGLVQKIFGEKSLSEFAEQLVAFGPAIRDFGDTVKDVKPEAVQGASAAAEIMANLADKLPTQGGLVQKIFGEKSLSEFGDELILFGPKISKFADQVKNVNAASVTGASMITEIMTKLANELPSSETLLDKIFGGGQMPLSEFGDELILFGASMSSFASYVSEINVEQVNGAITSFKDMIDLSAYAKDASASDLVNFVNQLGQISVNSLDKFVRAFSQAGPKATQGLINGINSKKALATSTVRNLCTAITNQLRTSLAQSTFNKYGQNIVQGLVNGVNSKKPLAISTINELCSAIVSSFRNGLSSNNFKTVGDGIVNAFRSSLSQTKFKEIGANAALGLKAGIESKIDEVAKAAAESAKKAVEASKKELDENSPSKVMKEVGQYFSIGLANGITDQIKMIAKAGTQASDEAIKPVKKAVNGIKAIVDSGNFDVDPVIRPVMDLSNVQAGAREIGSLMNRRYNLSSVYNRAMDVSSSFNTTKKERTGKEEINSKSGNGDKYEFNQFNYSPKALSRSEIYRQTNNQFSEFRRAVKLT